MNATADRLVLAPHADDETMGCGGMLAKYPDDNQVVVVVAHMTATREAEYLEAMERLGRSRRVLCLDLVDGAVGGDMPGLVATLDRLFRCFKPREVYLPYPSLHQDHIATYEAGMRACRVSMTDGHWFPPSVLVYDIAAYDLTLYPSDLRWNVFEELTQEHVEKKVAACEAYVSETPTSPLAHPNRSLRQIAEATGALRMLPYAEQYALVRQVRAA